MLHFTRSPLARDIVCSIVYLAGAVLILIATLSAVVTGLVSVVFRAKHAIHPLLAALRSRPHADEGRGGGHRSQFLRDDACTQVLKFNTLSIHRAVTTHIEALGSGVRMPCSCFACFLPPCSWL